MKKITKYFSVILIALLMASQLSYVSFAEDAPAELIGITVGNLSITDFDPSQTEYEVPVFYKYAENDFETVDVPEIKAYAVSPEAEVEIIQPDSTDDTAQITVTCGQAEKTYTLSFTKKAMNMMTDGGFETSAPFNYYRTIGFASSASTDSPKAGTQALTHSNTVWSPLWVHPADMVAKAGTTYIVTYYTRDPGNSGKSWYGGNKGTYSASAFYNEDGSQRSGDYLGKLGTSWSRVIQTYVPSSNLSGSSMAYGPITMSSAEPIEIDEMYISPLAVTDIIYTGDKTLNVPVEGEESITLSAVVKNQIGGSHGLENLSIEYTLIGDYSGVSLDGDELTVSAGAPAGTVLVRMAVTHNLEGEEKTAFNIAPIVLSVPEPSKAELLTIHLGGLSIPDFNPLIKEYDFKVPYSYISGDFDTVTVPVVECIPKNDDARVSISYPDTVEGGTITVDVTCGDDNETYTINLEPVGLNIYDDGGFETDAWVNANNYRTDINGSALMLSDLYPKAGSYSLSYEVPNGKFLYAPLTPKLTGGVTYLHSVYIRQPGGGAFGMFNGSSGSDVRSYYNENGSIKSGDSVSGVTEEWTHLISTHLANSTKDFMSSPFHYSDTNFTAELDELFMAPMVITGITYTGDDLNISIPESDTDTVISLGARMYNGLGGVHGLENSKVVFGFADDYPGVRIENNQLIVTQDATDGPIILTMTADTSFQSVQGKIVNTVAGYLRTVSQDAEIPKVRYITADRDRSSVDYTVVGDYTYYQALGEDEGSTIINWQYGSSNGGSFSDIPGAEALTYTVENQYRNSYLRLAITPVTEGGIRGSTYYSETIAPPAAPTAGNVRLEGIRAVDEVITGYYDYYDVNADEEQGTVREWLISDSISGPFVPVAGANTDTYTVSQADIGKYLIYKVTPTSAVEPTVGAPVSSEPMLCAAYPAIKNVEIVKNASGVYGVSYKYSHDTNITEGATKIEWTDGINILGNKSSISLSAEPAKLTVRIIPVASKPPYEGAEVSATITIKTETAGKVTRPSSGGGGGGFGGGGSSVIVPVPEVKTEEIPEVIEPQRHWAADGIEFCKSRGIMQDYARDDFGNTQLVMRAELVAYIIKVLGASESEYTHIFADVDVRDYFAGALQTAVDMGIISRAENFEPHRHVTRQEVCKILVTAFGEDIEAEADLTKFTDLNSIGDWAQEYVSKAVSKGMLKGISDYEFNPLGSVTREQTAVILKRLYDLRNGGSVQ